MPTRTRIGAYTFNDFLELVREDQKADLLEGMIYMASPENLDHNDLVRWLTNVLGEYVEERDLGRVTVNRVAFRLASRNAPEPDIAFIRKARLDALRPGYVDGPPDLAVEFISPDSVDRDYELKRRVYEQHGVGEYWIIDAEESRATFLVREGDAFVEAALDGGKFRSRAVPGFWLDPAWLFQRPLPKSRRVVDEILATSHA